MSRVGEIAAAVSALIAAWAAREAGRAATSAGKAAEAAADLTRTESERWQAEKRAQRSARLICSSEVEADGPLDSGRLLFIVTKNLGPSFAVNVRMQASAEGLGIEYEAPEFPLLHPHSDLRMPVGRIRPGPYMVPVKLSWLDWTGEHDEAHLVAGTA